MSEKLYTLICKVLKIPFNEINDNTSPQTVSTWTSFIGYVMLNELENTFNVKFSIDEAMDVKNVADIKRHLKNHGVSID